MNQIIKTVFIENSELKIIDQRLLPVTEKIITLSNKEEVFDAIKTLAVRGAPAIGVAAAYGVWVAAKNQNATSLDLLKKNLLAICDYLSQSRPTAYNLFYALDRQREVIQGVTEVSKMTDALLDSAVKFHEEDIEKSDAMGQHGLTVVPNDARILTHCNAGGLATGGNGTALSVIFAAQNAGKLKSVWVDETRPLLQGARLTAWELTKQNIDHKVISDNMSGFVMSRGEVDMIVVGADRIAANGDFANKIGTYSLGILAQYHGVPFYTAAPLTTFDLSLSGGKEIPIEERKPDEILKFRDCQSAPKTSSVFNPAFDVCPGHLLSGIITEYGVIYPPFKENISKIIGKANAEN